MVSFVVIHATATAIDAAQVWDLALVLGALADLGLMRYMSLRI